MNQLIEKEREHRRTRTYEESFQRLIPSGGYRSPNPYLMEDVLLSIVLKKPVLLKGPSGSGKTKLAESISNYFQQPMQSVNCSVDLDAESLLGIKPSYKKMVKH